MRHRRAFHENQQLWGTTGQRPTRLCPLMQCAYVSTFWYVYFVCMHTRPYRSECRSTHAELRRRPGVLRDVLGKNRQGNDAYGVLSGCSEAAGNVGGCIYLLWPPLANRYRLNMHRTMSCCYPRRHIPPHTRTPTCRHQTVEGAHLVRALSRHWHCSLASRERRQEEMCERCASPLPCCHAGIGSV